MITILHSTLLTPSVGSLTINLRDGSELYIDKLKTHDTAYQLAKAALEQPECTSIVLVLTKGRI